MHTPRTIGLPPERTTPLAPIRLGPKDAAEYLSVSPDTLRYWRYQGIGPRSYRLGRHTFYDVADLDEWVADQKAKTAVGGV
jgi:hypothetical protein